MGLLPQLAIRLGAVAWLPQLLLQIVGAEKLSSDSPAGGSRFST